MDRIPEPIQFQFNRCSRIQSDERRDKIPCRLSAKKQRLFDLVPLAIREMAEVGTEITITFRPHYRARYSEPKIRSFLRNVLYGNITNPDASIILMPEHGTSLNLHYHGIITGLSTQELNQLQVDINTFCGRSEIKCIQYTQSYADYICKEWKMSNLHLLITKNVKFDLSTPIPSRCITPTLPQPDDEDYINRTN